MAVNTGAMKKHLNSLMIIIKSEYDEYVWRMPCISICRSMKNILKAV
jgi:hypothetical protein